MGEAEWPYNLPIWRSSHRAASPDGKLVAQINPAYEVSMGNPTSGILCISNGLHIPRCNPSFIWSNDSRFLAVPRYFEKLGLFRRQRLLVIDFERPCVYASNATTYYFQPETVTAGRLVVALNPFRSKRKIEFQIPGDLPRLFKRDPWVFWPERESVTTPPATA